MENEIHACQVKIMYFGRNTFKYASRWSGFRLKVASEELPGQYDQLGTPMNEVPLAWGAQRQVLVDAGVWKSCAVPGRA